MTPVVKYIKNNWKKKKKKEFTVLWVKGSLKAARDAEVGSWGKLSNSED